MLPGALLLTATPLLFVFGVVEVGLNTQPLIWVSALAGSLICRWLFVAVERRTIHAMVPLSFFRDRSRVMANLATTPLSAALSTSFLLFTFYLQQRLGMSPLNTGLLLLPLAIVLVIAATFVPRLLNRWGARACAFIGILFTAAAMITIAVGVYRHAPAPAMIAAMIMIAVGMGFGIVGLQYAAVSGVTAEDAGMASGIQRAADQLGGATSIALYVGIGFAPVFAGNTPYLITSILALAGLGVAGIFASRISRSTRTTVDSPDQDRTV